MLWEDFHIIMEEPTSCIMVPRKDEDFRNMWKIYNRRNIPALYLIYVLTTLNRSFSKRVKK